MRLVNDDSLPLDLRDDASLLPDLVLVGDNNVVALKLLLSQVLELGLVLRRVLEYIQLLREDLIQRKVLRIHELLELLDAVPDQRVVRDNQRAQSRAPVLQLREVLRADQGNLNDLLAEPLLVREDAALVVLAFVPELDGGRCDLPRAVAEIELVHPTVELAINL